MTESPARIEGIGGVFLKANNPKALAEWYARHFGLEFQSSACGKAENFWLEFASGDHSQPDKRAATVFAIQSAESVLPAERHAVEINYRVNDLGRLLAQLTAAGIKVEKREDYEYGRFAWIRDLENNRIELYQPA